MWSLKLPKKEDAKIIALWMNSSLHLLQILLNKIEDVWIDVHKYVLDDYLVINPNMLTKSERKELSELFDEIGSKEFPNLVTQIKEKNSLRQKIDQAFLSILDFKDNEIEPYLNSLCAAIANEIKEIENIAIS